jgi:hypothetical protein
MPISAKELMHKRIETKAFNIDWLKKYETSDIIATYEGKIKIMSYDKNILLLDNIDKKYFDSLEGFELSRKEVNKYAQFKDLSMYTLLENPIWQQIAGDKELLREYIRFSKRAYLGIDKTIHELVMPLCLNTKYSSDIVKKTYGVCGNEITLLTMGGIKGNFGISNPGDTRTPYSQIIGVKEFDPAKLY